jgi:hypothetical protein
MVVFPGKKKKRMKSESDYSFASIAEVINVWSFMSTPPKMST